MNDPWMRLLACLLFASSLLGCVVSSPPPAAAPCSACSGGATPRPASRATTIR